jgi:signal peptidase II
VKPYGRLLGAAALVVAADQVTKTLALENLKHDSVEVIPGLLSLRITYNSGGAFGIFQGMPLVFLLAGLVIGAVILLWVRSMDDGAWLLPFGIVLGGGLGNVIDRIVRSPGGEVVDFIDFHVGDFQWPLFNLADMAIVVGVGLILIFNSRAEKRDADEAGTADEPSERGSR